MAESMPARATRLEQFERVFEQALVEVSLHARDGAGLRVNIAPRGPNARDVRQALLDMLEQSVGDVVFMCRAGSAAAEAAYWENVALLARALAAAIRFEEAKDHG